MMYVAKFLNCSDVSLTTLLPFTGYAEQDAIGAYCV